MSLKNKMGCRQTGGGGRTLILDMAGGITAGTEAGNGVLTGGVSMAFGLDIFDYFSLPPPPPQSILTRKI